MLVRLTRGCRWNRCRFCGIYPQLGEHGFSIRSVEEVKHDINLLSKRRRRLETAFFGDSDPLQAGVDAFCEIAGYLRVMIPALKRLTCYARTSTLYKLKQRAIEILARAGLNRIHIGLESGDPETLRFHRKGQSPEMVKKVAAWLKDAGIEISFYVLLGLGGSTHWQRHIRETARIINETEPEFVRIRRLWVFGCDSIVPGPGNPLLQDILAGAFTPQTPEGTVRELRLFLEHLASSLTTFLTCDHHNNYVHVSGTVRDDKEDMLAEIDSFLSLPLSAREAHYQAVGSHI